MPSPALELLVGAIAELSRPKGLILLAICGVLVHRLYFVRGEHHLLAPVYFVMWFFSTLVPAAALYIVDRQLDGGLGPESGLDPVRTPLLFNAAFLGALFGSMTVYRVFEHHLRDFSGPPLAAVSKLWHLAHMFHEENYTLLERMRQKYGTFVRTGPQELTVFHPDVFNAVGGLGSPYIKAPMYDMFWPLVSVNTIRTKEGYGPRRRRWDESLGLSKSYLPDKEHRVQKYAALFVQRMRQCVNVPVAATIWYYHFSFDVMGDIAFGRSFDLVQGLEPNTKLDGTPQLISHGMAMVRFFIPIPWIGRLCISAAPLIPFLSQTLVKALSWAIDLCNARLDAGAAEHAAAAARGEAEDAFSRFVLSAKRDGDSESLDRFALYGDAFAITVAGSHSTTETLTMLSWQLALRPELQAQLRKEIQEANLLPGGVGKDADDAVNMSALDKMPLLDGCINEALRLFPALPTAGIRQTIDKPVMVDGTWIPANTVVVAPRWSIGRLESAFDQPNDFIPERWTTRPEMVKNKDAFNAFGSGRHLCPGKALGIMEIRMLAAMLLANFHFSMAPGKENQTRVLDKYQDAFTATPGDLSLVFTPVQA